VRDMEVLAESPPSELPAKLQPLITAYAEWLSSENGSVPVGSGLAITVKPLKKALARGVKARIRIKRVSH